MATSLDYSVDLSAVTLDLDTVPNIGHPCLELLHPNPDIYKLFEYFNEIFFDGLLKHRVNLEWLQNMHPISAGETYLPQRGQSQMRINLNLNLLRNRSRKSIIETLLHEMIHSYLIHTNKEDKDDSHGEHFVEKMSEINSLARINITVNHNYCTDTAPRRRSRKSTNGDEAVTTNKFYMWRCRGDCRNAPPYFGFMWIEEKREPSPHDLMWVNTDECEHVFEKFGNHGNPKDWLTEWDCIIIFNEFILDNKIQIKSKEIQNIDDGASTSNPVVIDAIDTLDRYTPIANELYINFDAETRNFIDMAEYLPIGSSMDLPQNAPYRSSTACMICCGIIDEKKIIEHLEQCSGLKFSLQSEQALPIVKVTNQKESL